jgi:hypothetical protein
MRLFDSEWTVGIVAFRFGRWLRNFPAAAGASNFVALDFGFG